MDALVVTNMWPTEAQPALGRFVYDQVQALRTLTGVSVEVYSFAPGGMPAYARAVPAVQRRFAGRKFDVVHAHFGLSAWPALGAPARRRVVTLHGTDLAHPRSRAITLAALRRYDVVGVVSAELGQKVPRRALQRGSLRVLPCGVDMERFQPVGRAEARAALGLSPDGRVLLFPASPARPEKRFDQASELAASADAQLLTLGNVAPERVPLYVNAADAVLVTSEREGFGLAALEALACDVPVLATPHGIAPATVGTVAGCLCAPFSLDRWAAALAAVPERVAGRDVAAGYSSVAMAEQVLAAWRG